MDSINTLLFSDCKTKINEAINNIIKLYNIPLNFEQVDDAFIKIKKFLHIWYEPFGYNCDIDEIIKKFLLKYLSKNVNLCTAIFLKLNSLSTNNDLSFLHCIIRLDYGPSRCYETDFSYAERTLRDLINYYNFDFNELNLSTHTKCNLQNYANEIHSGKYTKPAIHKK